MIIFWETLKGDGVGGSCDYPAVSDVRLGVEYSGGALVGTLFVPTAPPSTNWPPADAQAGIYLQLATDDALIELLGEDAGVVNTSTRVLDHVPDNHSFPYVSIYIKPWNDRGNGSFEGFECELQINVWYRSPGRGDKQCQLIQKRIDELLHDQEFCIEGWNIVSIRRTLIDIITDEDNVTKHGIQRFKLLLGEI